MIALLKLLLGLADVELPVFCDGCGCVRCICEQLAQVRGDHWNECLFCGTHVAPNTFRCSELCAERAYRQAQDRQRVA